MTYPYMSGYFEFDLDYWNNRVLRPEDQFPALCYAFGISENKITQCSTIIEQLDLIEKEKTRIPEHVLEIGAGRGEVACSIAKLRVPITAVDVAIGIESWFPRTGKQFFGSDFVAPPVIESHIKNAPLDFSKFDTILLIESLEHITEEDFESTWINICNNFNGILCITNLYNTHPIPIGGDWEDAELQHCRVVDDTLFDKMASEATRTVFRRNSHLVLEF